MWFMTNNINLPSIKQGFFFVYRRKGAEILHYRLEIIFNFCIFLLVYKMVVIHNFHTLQTTVRTLNYCFCNKISTDWFPVCLFVTQSAHNHVGG